MVKKLLILTLILTSCNSFSVEPEPQQKCDVALAGCQVLTQEQDKSIQMLKRSGQECEADLTKATEPPLISKDAIFIIGLLVGAVTTVIIRR